ncbi:MAG TPA: hypothetical protein VJ813_10315 [Vicinamibacterales bacterium]|nr:hypothetical protein [Vicinamibacterales bacterium]
MAQQDRPNQNANKDKAEGERWSSEPDTVRKADRDENPEQLYEDEGAGDAGGITNRPLPEEIGSQEALPDRGTSRDRTANPDPTRTEGDYTEKDR